MASSATARDAVSAPATTMVPQANPVQESIRIVSSPASPPRRRQGAAGQQPGAHGPARPLQHARNRRTTPDAHPAEKLVPASSLLAGAAVDTASPAAIAIRHLTEAPPPPPSPPSPLPSARPLPSDASGPPSSRDQVSGSPGHRPTFSLSPSRPPTAAYVPSTPSQGDSDVGSGLHIGGRYRIDGQANRGCTLRFVGRVDAKLGVWCGVDCDAAIGRHDGLVEGKRYFTAGPQHGFFLRPARLVPEGAGARAGLGPTREGDGSPGRPRPELLVRAHSTAGRAVTLPLLLHTPRPPPRHAQQRYSRHPPHCTRRVQLTTALSRFLPRPTNQPHYHFQISSNSRFDHPSPLGSPYRPPRGDPLSPESAATVARACAGRPLQCFNARGRMVEVQGACAHPCARGGEGCNER